jgi:hypothetical protein
MFAGFLPSHPPGTKLLGRYDRVWRSRAARQWNHDVYQYFRGKSIMDAYIEEGWNTYGLGGVQFFDPGIPENSLPALFPEFVYVPGVTDKIVGDDSKLFPESPGSVLLGIASGVVSKEPFFWFVNFPETHFPYWTPGQPRGYEVNRLLRTASEFINSKSRIPDGHPLIRDGGLNALRLMQIRALEYVDAQLAKLFVLLGNANLSTLVVVCADHGESFGEGGRLGHGHPGDTVTSVPMWVGRIVGSRAYRN